MRNYIALFPICWLALFCAAQEKYESSRIADINEKPTRGAVPDGPSMNPLITVGTSAAL
jgi:hypothetical protein